MSKKDLIEKRILREGAYIIIMQSTIRETAKAFGVCKSTVMGDVAKLQEISPILYREVRSVVDTNKKERYARGGEATKRHWRVQEEPKTEVSIFKFF